MTMSLQIVSHRELALCAALLLPVPLVAQQIDTLRLGVLQRQAEAADHRAAQRELVARQSDLRVRSIERERLPTMTLLGQAQHLSDVTSFAGGGPLAPPAPYQTQYDAAASLRAVLVDPTRGDRRALEAAQRTEAEARIATTLWSRRDQVSDAFFQVARLEAQRQTLAAARADLEARRRVAQVRVEGGTALPSEVLLLEAELLRRDQTMDEVEANLAASREVLASLVGAPVESDAILVLPDLAEAVAAAVATAATDRSRPEFAQFDDSRAVLTARAAALDGVDDPRLSLFGRGGYGRPGLNQLSRTFDSYYQAGIQVEWSPWDWGRRDRERAAQALQAEIVSTEEAAFAESLARAVVRDRAAIAHLERTLVSDTTVIALRERILAELRLRFEEGAVTAAEYVDRETDLLLARLDRDAHRIRLVEARAHLLTTLGHEVP